MIRTVTAIGTLIVLLAITQTCSASAHRSRLRRCAPPTDTAIVASNAHVQVYKLLSDDKRTGIYACMRSGHGSVFLGEFQALEGNECPRKEEGKCWLADEPTLAGACVAYIETPVEDIHAKTLVVRSVATGRALHRVAIHVRTIHLTMLEGAQVLQILAKADGAVAWVQQDSFARHGGAEAPPNAYSIFAVDREGFHALTPEVPTPPRLLKLTGSTLSWRNEATPETAVLD